MNRNEGCNIEIYYWLSGNYLLDDQPLSHNDSILNQSFKNVYAIRMHIFC